MPEITLSTSKRRTQRVLTNCYTISYLLLITTMTCFGHNSWPSSGSYQVASTYTAYVVAYAKVVGIIHQCLNTYTSLKSLKSASSFAV